MILYLPNTTILVGRCVRRKDGCSYGSSSTDCDHVSSRSKLMQFHQKHDAISSPSELMATCCWIISVVTKASSTLPYSTWSLILLGSPIRHIRFCGVHAGQHTESYRYTRRENHEMEVMDSNRSVKKNSSWYLHHRCPTGKIRRRRFP